ncbi:MAG: hypothetical protein ABEJ26_02080, partial [Halosimplex sp.]
DWGGVFWSEHPFLRCPQILHFVDCVETGADPLTSGRDNLGTMAAIRAVYESAERDGERVRTDDVLAEAREAAR